MAKKDLLSDTIFSLWSVRFMQTWPASQRLLIYKLYANRIKYQTSQWTSSVNNQFMLKCCIGCELPFHLQFTALLRFRVLSHRWALRNFRRRMFQTRRQSVWTRWHLRPSVADRIPVPVYGWVDWRSMSDAPQPVQYRSTLSQSGAITRTVVVRKA